ncbi:MAG: glucose-6-phosphate isomerase family protein [bacterium]|nr:glucose-6-phosphate isomerase family protein [bacterium]
MEFNPLATREHEKMKDVLMHPEDKGPAIHYYMIRGGSSKRNITIWESGTVGGEYIKTYGHYHIGQLDETYSILAGEGIALLQKLVEENGVPQIDRVEEFKAIKVKAGDSVYMPPGYGHLLVNTGKQWFVTSDDSPVFGADDSAGMPGHADYEMVRKMRGFAYYVVEKDGAPVLVANPLYKKVRAMDVGNLPVQKSA